MAEVFTSLLLIVAVAFVAPLISWTIPKRLVPEVVLLILGGMLIGPHGLGGRTTALAVHIEVAAVHMASLPVAVNINCHVTRHESEVL